MLNKYKFLISTLVLLVLIPTVLAQGPIDVILDVGKLEWLGDIVDQAAFVRILLFLALYAVLGSILKRFLGGSGTLVAVAFSVISVIFIPPGLLVGIGATYGAFVVWLLFGIVIWAILWINFKVADNGPLGRLTKMFLTAVAIGVMGNFTTMVGVESGEIGSLFGPFQAWILTILWIMFWWHLLGLLQYAFAGGGGGRLGFAGGGLKGIGKHIPGVKNIVHDIEKSDDDADKLEELAEYTEKLDQKFKVDSLKQEKEEERIVKLAQIAEKDLDELEQEYNELVTIGKDAGSSGSKTYGPTVAKKVNTLKKQYFGKLKEILKIFLGRTKSDVAKRPLNFLSQKGLIRFEIEKRKNLIEEITILSKMARSGYISRMRDIIDDLEKKHTDFNRGAKLNTSQKKTFQGFIDKGDTGAAFLQKANDAGNRVIDKEIKQMRAEVSDAKNLLKTISTQKLKDKTQMEVDLKTLENAATELQTFTKRWPTTAEFANIKAELGKIVSITLLEEKRSVGEIKEAQRLLKELEDIRKLATSVRNIYKKF